MFLRIRSEIPMFANIGPELIPMLDRTGPEYHYLTG